MAPPVYDAHWRSRYTRYMSFDAAVSIARDRPLTHGAHMAKVTYEIVEHDGGWAYRVGDVYSETFRTHDLARKAAERAAREQEVPGDTAEISYEDKRGRWHDEHASGDDRPETDVEG
jgi:hypothetical protein